jgi:ComF family protein
MRAACVYDDFSRDIMLPFKHAGALKYQKIMSRAMIFALNELEFKPDLVMPVPLACRRLAWRGYNQAALLAAPIARHLGVRSEVSALRRKHRPDMGRMNARQRRENIRDVFGIRNPSAIKDKIILLVDDVMTTGATFAELNKTLKRAGAKAVYGIVFCRVVRAI